MRVFSTGTCSWWLRFFLLAHLCAACTRESQEAADALPVTGLVVISLDGQAEWQADANAAWQSVAVNQRVMSILLCQK